MWCRWVRVCNIKIRKDCVIKKHTKKQNIIVEKFLFVRDIWYTPQPNLGWICGHPVHELNLDNMYQMKCSFAAVSLKNLFFSTEKFVFFSYFNMCVYGRISRSKKKPSNISWKFLDIPRKSRGFKIYIRYFLVLSFYGQIQSIQILSPYISYGRKI